MTITTPATLRQTYRTSVSALVDACRDGDDDRAISLLYSTRDLLNAMPASDKEESFRHLRATLRDLSIQGKISIRVGKAA